jgi:alkylated DNA repair protein alkB family protein 5
VRIEHATHCPHELTRPVALRRYEVRLLRAPPVAAPRPQTFELMENVRGKRMNTLSGLALFKDVLSPAEQVHVLAYSRRICELGDDGALMGRTYSAPRRWMRGKGRVTVQLGCCYNYARDAKGNPPGIIPSEAVCGMPPLYEDIIDRMVSRGIFDARTRPNSCIVNFYSEGDCIPPHIDHHDFTRPFVTLSLLSEQPILFGEKIAIVDDGEFDAPFSLPLPLGSVLVLDGNGANVAKHCVPAVCSDRVSITFRKIGPKIKMSPFKGPDGQIG